VIEEEKAPDDDDIPERRYSYDPRGIIPRFQKSCTI
jgi:hypothetical protein